MARSIGLAHVIRHEDGTATGVWGVYALKSAFQPIFAFNEGRLSIVAFEGLIRPFRDGEPETPAVFFSGCPPVDRLHIEGLTRTMHLLNAGACLPEDMSVFINFDPSVFTDRSISDAAMRDMRLVLHEANIDPRRVVCEVTEQKTVSQEALYDFVAALRDSGFRIAVDDYGADESDITRIQELKPDIVKFDAVWIAQLMESGAGFALLKAMVKSFEEQGIHTVFEGIEENWQLELAEKSGASMVQGFVLARPEIASPALRSMVTAAEPSERPGESGQAETTQPARAPGRTAKVFGRRTAR
ncbi:diguanylate phosphodiesterase [Mesorhizobium sp. Root157]|uniref:EAL domain-containing protein n=1 Tax=Mesorhizobium sp. Root157 TaxID=1736477 RepID=UPI0006FD7446|nr:EAL domain-containing protein [Mesorhizobium sp. Root157]KQZ87152.1 diguanylate phosphodiesterase [Mesorhizobium sp. Root157]